MNWLIKGALALAGTITAIGGAAVLVALSTGMWWAAVGEQPFHSPILMGILGALLVAVGVVLLGVVQEERSDYA